MFYPTYKHLYFDNIRLNAYYNRYTTLLNYLFNNYLPQFVLYLI